MCAFARSSFLFFSFSIFHFIVHSILDRIGTLANSMYGGFCFISILLTVSWIVGNKNRTAPRVQRQQQFQLCVNEFAAFVSATHTHTRIISQWIERNQEIYELHVFFFAFFLMWFAVFLTYATSNQNPMSLEYVFIFNAWIYIQV